jgi:hypothetical protein
VERRPLSVRPKLTGDEAERLVAVLLRRASATSEIEERRMRSEVRTQIEERYEIGTVVIAKAA